LIVANFLSNPITDPVAIFLTILAIMLVAPLLFERFQLPGIVGLILAGVVVGPDGLGLLERDGTIVLLGTVGLLFLMFMAGLETSLDDFKEDGDKAAIFGIATFLIPLVIGTVAMLWLGYGWLAAILVASCFSSHTLLALPVLNKLGIMRSPPVSVTLGATLITNVLALLTLAVIIKAYEGSLTLSFWLFLIPALVIYTLACLWGIPRLGRWFFHKFGHDENAEFTFVLATLFVVSYAASVIEIEPIIGAFLAGIALTPLIPQMSPLMNRIQFIGNALFVPFFLISVGMLIDPVVLIREPRVLVIASVMVVAELVGKYAAAWIAGKMFGFKSPDVMVMFGLSIAQAASTLAAITVAFNIELVDQLTVNGVVAMILVTSILSPWVVQRWGTKVNVAAPKSEGAPIDLMRRVLVTVANPNTEDTLLNLAIVLAKAGGGTLLPLNVLSDHKKAVSAADKRRQVQLLEIAEDIAHAAATKVEPIGRVDDAIDKGILRTAVEQDASLIVCGWKGYSSYKDNFFGDVLDNVARQAHVPVLVTRFVYPVSNTGRIIFAVNKQQALSANFIPTLKIVQTIATELKSTPQILIVTGRKESRLSDAELAEISSDIEVEQTKGNLFKRISKRLQPNDLLVLEVNTRKKPVTMRPAIGQVPEEVVRSHPEVSIIVAHYP
jgi:Kef-type K+ transport system membrane component KefB/nucleotide-binding universal stress UspA family protein